MRLLRFAFVAAGLVASTAFGSPLEPKQGVEYTVLAQPQPAQADGNKVEVIEFFMYHCPHCHALEPVLEQWVKNHGSNITFKRIHLPYRGANDPEAHLFLTLRALGKNEEMQMKVMDAVRNILVHGGMPDDQALASWATKQPGIDRARFLDAWNSFGVMTKLRRLPALAGNDYGVNGAPTIVVGGRYVTSELQLQHAMPEGTPEPRLFDALLQVVDVLVAKARKPG